MGLPNSTPSRRAHSTSRARGISREDIPKAAFKSQDWRYVGCCSEQSRLRIIRYSSQEKHLLDKKGVEGYEKLIENLNNLYFEMDRKYYDELEGKPDDMKQLAKHMDKVGRNI